MMLSADNIAYRRVLSWLIDVINGNPIVTPWQSRKLEYIDKWLRIQINDE
jgi:hypothetical protein